MARLGFSWVWLGLAWFGLFPCLKKDCGENTGVEEQKGKRPSWKKTYRRKELTGKNRRGKDRRRKDLAAVCQQLQAERSPYDYSVAAFSSQTNLLRFCEQI